ncbi:MAG: hypothetical protein ABWJ97_04185 [Thermoproteus sp.]
MACPKCGSRDVKVTPSAMYVCKSCGYSWSIPEADLSWAQKIFTSERLYEELKNIKADCAKLREEITKRGLSPDEAAKVARRIVRRNIKLTNDKREKEALRSSISRC